jgi:methylated-DNA-[protein]-cysteine S-methyltransferase
MIHSYLPSPIGDLLLTGDGHSLTGLYTPGHVRLPAALGERSDREFAQAHRQLTEYFAGERTDFELALAPAGSPFQQRVWHQLRQIPLGRTCSYGQLALAIGQPTAVRAVGMANGRNPISIIVPCHRVVGSTGALTGYAGGLAAKRWLLAHEQEIAGHLTSPSGAEQLQLTSALGR